MLGAGENISDEELKSRHVMATGNVVPPIRDNNDVKAHYKEIAAALPQPYNYAYVEAGFLVIEYADGTPFKAFKKQIPKRIGGLMINFHIVGPFVLGGGAARISDIQRITTQQPEENRDPLTNLITGNVLTEGEQLVAQITFPHAVTFQVIQGHARKLWVGFSSLADLEEYRSNKSKRTYMFGGLDVNLEIMDLKERVPQLSDFTDRLALSALPGNLTSAFEHYPNLSPGQILTVPKFGSVVSAGVAIRIALFAVGASKLYLSVPAHAFSKEQISTYFFMDWDWRRRLRSWLPNVKIGTRVYQFSHGALVGELAHMYVPGELIDANSPASRILSNDVALIELSPAVSFQNIVQGQRLTSFESFGQLVEGNSYWAYCEHVLSFGHMAMTFLGTITDFYGVALAVFNMERPGNFAGVCGTPIYDSAGRVLGFFYLQIEETSKALVREIPSALRAAGAIA